MAAVWPLQMSPVHKSVLVSLADNANDEGVCWPSVATICERTCLSRRSVQGAINSLIEAGFLVATERDGRSNVYQITSAAGAPAQQAHLRRTCAPPAQDMRTPCAPPAPRTVIEPSREPSSKKPVADATVELPPWMPMQTWQAWIDYRKSRRLSVSPVAIKGHVSILTKLRTQGQDVAAVIQQSIDQGWQGLFALKSQAVSRTDEKRKFFNELTGNWGRGTEQEGSTDDSVIEGAATVIDG